MMRWDSWGGTSKLGKLVPVFVHPWDMHTSPRLDRWMGRWLAGMPSETHLSILAAILGGEFDKVPASLRICFAHGGGSFAFWLGRRLESAWQTRGDVIATSQQPPLGVPEPVQRPLGRLRADCASNPVEPAEVAQVRDSGWSGTHHRDPETGEQIVGTAAGLGFGVDDSWHNAAEVIPWSELEAIAKGSARRGPRTARRVPGSVAPAPVRGPAVHGQRGCGRVWPDRGR